MNDLYTIGDHTADFIVRACEDEEKRLKAALRLSTGPENARHRKVLRARIYDLSCVVAGLNTGNGVTRGSAS